MGNGTGDFRRRSVDLRIDQRVGPAPAPSLDWIDDHHLRLGTCDFHCSYPLRDVPDGHLGVMKARAEVEGYAALARTGDHPRIVELGIHSGGSTALLRELFQPDRLVAFELSETPVRALEQRVAERGLGDVVRSHYGVDQSDRTRLADIVEDELGGELVDLVVDDASHRYDETVASFEVLFPRLRPGGRYVIEDWRWQHDLAAAMKAARLAGGEQAERLSRSLKRALADRVIALDARPTAFSTLVLQLVLARACGDEIATLTIGRNNVEVVRGTGPIQGSSFRLADLYDDDAGQLVTA